MENFIKPEQFPYKTPTGWEYDSGDYGRALQKALDLIGYDDLRKEQAEKRARGELMGIGISSFTEIVGAGPSHDFDILGLKMFDSCEIRVHPTGKVLARIGVQRLPGQRHQDRVRRHGYRALWAGHLRVAFDTGRGRRHGRRGQEGP
jgi:carbon-monoxide dehydrogenase large subunit